MVFFDVPRWIYRLVTLHIKWPTLLEYNNGYNQDPMWITNLVTEIEVTNLYVLQIWKKGAVYGKMANSI